MTAPTRHITEGGKSLCLIHAIIVYLQVLACVLIRLLEDACIDKSQSTALLAAMISYT